jgi:hypothetical protein
MYSQSKSIVQVEAKRYLDVVLNDRVKSIIEGKVNHPNIIYESIPSF